MTDADLKKEFVKAIMISLKIDSNPFISSTIDEFTAHIDKTQFKSFMTALFGEQHQYLNGIDRVAKVAEIFKPKNSEDDEITKEAKRLISGVEAMNTLLFNEAHKTGEMFESKVRGCDFKNVTEKSIAILNNVRPYYDIKELVINIRRYQTSIDTLNAFKQAIKQSNQNESLAIDRRVFKQIAKN